MKSLFCHKSILIRFVSLYAFGILFFLVVWYLSYFLLPDGVLRGKSAASLLAGDDTPSNFTREFLKIFSINLVLSLIIVYANYSSKIYDYPLGYVIPILWFVYYGICLGTNSFSVPMSHRIAPSLVVLNRSGLYEMAAYTLIAVSTYLLPRYEQKKFFSLKRKAIYPADRHPITGIQWIGITVAVVLLLLSNFREVYMLINK